MNKKLILIFLVLCCSTSLFGTIVQHVGSYGGWDSASWSSIDGLNDPTGDVGSPQYDFIGNISDSGAYWADNGTYVFFRFRLAIDTITSGGDLLGAHHVLIDNGGDYSPDYGFSWDSINYAKPNSHGLEMMIAGGTGDLWQDISMADIDGNSGTKSNNDINGDISGRGYDGYIRTVDGQADSFGTSSFVDYAVSWEYLETYTGVARGQSWNIALASADANDHADFTAANSSDIAGGASPASNSTTGWSSIGVVPEPATISLIGISGIVLFIRRRLKRRD
jgi:hypothetical protein